MNFIKENGGPLVVGAVVIGFFVGYAELRLPAMVDEEMDSRGLISSGDFAALQDDLADQKVVHKEDRDRMDSKIERIIDILLEE